MNVVDTFYLPRPDDDENGERKYLCFRLTDDWVAIDGQKLLLPVAVDERNGQSFDEQKGILSQYGGHQLLTQMLLDLDGKPSKGDEFILEYDEFKGFTISAV